MRVPLIVIVGAALLAGCRVGQPSDSKLILWAWERPENLRFAADAEIALQTGFIELSGNSVSARGRRFPLIATAPPTIVVVHVQIDHARPLGWTPLLRRQIAEAVLHYATVTSAPRVQIDFEVRQSERSILLQVLADLRRSLPRATKLSMTALASWCMYEDWLSQAPVDEIVPMLFRMQKGSAAIVKTLARGGDFRHPRCRTALAISTDAPLRRAPPGRRVYLFNPRSWDQVTFLQAQRVVKAWR